MNSKQIRDWLRETQPHRLEELWQAADQARRDHVGDDVHLRALVEISSHCVRLCAYCGLRAPRTDLARYRMPREEILECAAAARKLGYGTVVLQAGEDPGLTMEWGTELVRRLRAAVPEMAITLSLGERTEDELRAWKQAGADRYLLRLETSNRELYDRIHPPLPGGRSDRVAILRTLRELGYEVGSGVMIGIPGQTYEDMARDIELFAELDLDMIGVGPFIPHPDTPLGNDSVAGVSPARGEGILPSSVSSSVAASSSAAVSAPLPPGEVPPSGGGKKGDRHHFPNSENGASPLFSQVPATEEMTYKVVALSRLVCPRANIPSTTALATLNRRDGRELGLMRGANVVMPNMTPVKYRKLYEIYPNKACVAETPAECGACLARRIRSIGRSPGSGRGDSPRKTGTAKTGTGQEMGTGSVFAIGKTVPVPISHLSPTDRDPSA
jgi:biotin synthase